MELNITRLIFTSIKLRKKLIICLLFFLLTTTAGATEYIVKPNTNDQAGTSISGENVVKYEDRVIPYWEFILYLVIMNVLSATDILLYPTKLIFAILGFRIVDKGDVLDNSNRSSIYAYIKKKPGLYIGEIADNTGLNRGLCATISKFLNQEI